MRASPARAMAYVGLPPSSVPASEYEPSVGGTRPVITLSRVVLPAPLGPISPTISSRDAVRLASTSARKPPNVTPIESATSSTLPEAAAGAAGSGACRRGRNRRRNHSPSSQSSTRPFGRKIMNSSIAPPRKMSVSPSRNSQPSPGTSTSGPAR